MKEVAKCIFMIGKARGTNAKVELLKQYADVPGVKEVLKFIYDPYVKTGIGIAKLKRMRANRHDIKDASWKAIIDYFNIHKTGRDKDVAAANTFIRMQETDEARFLVEAMVTKNLKIGVQAKTLNNLFGEDFIPMIGIMKAEKYKDYKNKVKGPYIVTEKFDGARRLIIKENGTVTLYTRSGHIDSGLVDIEEEAKYLPDNIVLDGELLAIGEFEDSIALRQATNAIANSKGERTGLTFNVFDVVPLHEYKRGKSTEGAKVRKMWLGAMFADDSIKALNPSNYLTLIQAFKLKYDFKFIQPVPILGVATTEEEVLSYAKPIWARHFEGVMLNTFDGLYDMTVDRSRSILKVKKVEELKLQIIDVEQGAPGNEFENTLGALIVDYKGNRVGVGSGLTVAQRHSIWANPGIFIGKFIEVDTFGESTNKDGGVSLNCPIFKRFVGAED